MKNFLKTTVVMAMMSISFYSCQKAVDRPAQIDPAISNDLVDIRQVSDVTTDAQYNAKTDAQNKILVTKAIGKVSDENQKAELSKLNEMGKIDFVILNKKVLLVQILPAEMSKAETSKQKNLQTRESLLKLKNASMLEDDKAQKILAREIMLDVANKITTTESKEQYFEILVEIGFKSGTLDNMRTDYNERKSILTLSEKSLAESTHIVLTEQIIDQAK